VSRERELYDFVIAAWPKRCGDDRTLMGWIEKAFLAFPDVDLLLEARKAAMWEAEKRANQKKSVRRFLTNWWARSEPVVRRRPGAKVVSLSAVRWLNRYNRSPDFLFERWARGKGVDSELVLSFCTYMGATAPDNCDEVVEVFLGGV